MSSTLYQAYRRQVLALANTLVIRMDAIAIIMNRYVEAHGYPVDWSNRATWRYYLNLAGQYHPLDIAQLKVINGGGQGYLKIKIAGTTGPVDSDFTTSLIGGVMGDTAIAGEYRWGSTYYNDLVRRYPDYETLILGILNPIPLSVSTTAPDGAILYCGGYYRSTVTDALGKRVVYTAPDPAVALVEPNETQLIPALQQYIDGYLVRWHNPDYALTDDLYIASLLGVLYLNIPLTVMNIRLKACHTPQVHSYHIREHLESHGRLAVHIPALPLKQKLWLYRNIRYIETNVGKQSTFDLLVDNLATPSGVPLSGYSIRHVLDDIKTNLVPTAVGVREVINFRHTGTGRGVVDIDLLLNREIPVARDNYRDIDIVGQEIDSRVVTSKTNLLPTKIIESAMLDTADRLPYPLAEVLLDQWIYTATHGLYDGTIYVDHPITGDRLHLTPINALILMIYCMNRGYSDITLVDVPTLTTRFTPRTDTPAILYDEMLSVTDSRYVSEDELIALLGAPAVTPDINSITGLYNYAVTVHTELMRRYNVCNGSQAAAMGVQVVVTSPDGVLPITYKAIDGRPGANHYIGSGHLEYAMSRLYQPMTVCTLSTDNYVDWLHSIGFVLTDMTRADYVTLAKAITHQATGNRVVTNAQLRALQKAVLTIMAQFSSYAVQYIGSINNGPALMMDPKATRYGAPRVQLKAIVQVPTVIVSALSISTLARQSLDVYINSTVGWSMSGTPIPIP